MASNDNLGLSEDKSVTKIFAPGTGTITKGLDEAIKKTALLEKSYERISKHVDSFTKKMKGGGSDSTMGSSLASMPSSAVSALRNGTYSQQGGMTGGQMLATGVMAAGATAMGIMPSTMSAVSQRLSAEAIGMYSSGNRSARSVITGANSMVGRGNATSIGGPTMAAGQILSMGGYGFGSATSRNILSQTGGMSATSGMSNEAVAGSYSAQNGMNMLRLGIRIRESDGSLRQPNQVVNELYAKLYRGGDPKNPELIYNPGSIEHQTVMAVAGGDSQMFEIYASLLIARAKNKKPITAKQMGSAKTMLGVMGNKKGIMGTNFDYQSSQNRLSQATESGAVAGYQGALSGAAAVNNGLAGMGELLPGVVNGLSMLKGVLETLPMTAAGSTAMGMAGPLAMMGMNGKGGGGGGAGGFAGKFGGKFNPSAGVKGVGAGIGLNIAGNALANGQAKGSARARAGNAAKWAGYASMLNFLGPEIGIPAMLLAAGAGAALGGGEDMGAASMETGGGAGSNGGAGQGGMAMPFTGSHPITSALGNRRDPNNPSATQHHNGIDYGMPVGTPVLAAADGIVDTVRVQPGNKRSYGRYIVIKHNGFYTYYAHLSAATVRVGQKVKQGEVIGKSGGAKNADGAGSSTGPHLHFEVRKSKSQGSSVDPKSIFGKLKSAVSSVVGAVSSLFGGGKSTIASKEMNWSSPVGSQSGVHTPLIPRIADILSEGSSIGFADLSRSGSVKNAEDIESILGSGGNTVRDGVSGDQGGMAYGSRKGLMSALYGHGFRGKALETAFAIALAESGGRAGARGDVGLQTKKWGPSLGPFQIRSLKDPSKYGASGKWRDGKKLLQPDFNLDAAKAISHSGTNWKAWSTYTSGSFTKYLDDAQTAARQAGIPVNFYGTGGGTEEGMHYLHEGEAVLPKMTADRLRNRPAGGGGCGITVNMNVNIARAGIEEVQVLLARFKTAIEQDATINQIGVY